MNYFLIGDDADYEYEINLKKILFVRSKKQDAEVYMVEIFMEGGQKILTPMIYADYVALRDALIPIPK